MARIQTVKKPKVSIDDTILITCASGNGGKYIAIGDTRVVGAKAIGYSPYYEGLAKLDDIADAFTESQLKAMLAYKKTVTWGNHDR